jgi:hypothetical protein
MKKQPKLVISRTTLRSLSEGKLARAAGGEDTSLCVYDQEPGSGSVPTNQYTQFPAYCSLVYSVCC